MSSLQPPSARAAAAGARRRVVAGGAARAPRPAARVSSERRARRGARGARGPAASSPPGRPETTTARRVVTRSGSSRGAMRRNRAGAPARHERADAPRSLSRAARRRRAIVGVVSQSSAHAAPGGAHARRRASSGRRRRSHGKSGAAPPFLQLGRTATTLPRPRHRSLAARTRGGSATDAANVAVGVTCARRRRSDRLEWIGGRRRSIAALPRVAARSPTPASRASRGERHHVPGRRSIARGARSAGPRLRRARAHARRGRRRRRRAGGEDRRARRRPWWPSPAATRTTARRSRLSSGDAAGGRDGGGGGGRRRRRGRRGGVRRHRWRRAVFRRKANGKLDYYVNEVLKVADLTAHRRRGRADPPRRPLGRRVGQPRSSTQPDEPFEDAQRGRSIQSSTASTPPPPPPPPPRAAAAAALASRRAGRGGRRGVKVARASSCARLVSTSSLRRLADSDSGVELLEDLQHRSACRQCPPTDDGAAAAARSERSAAASASAPLNDGEVVRERALVEYAAALIELAANCACRRRRRPLRIGRRPTLWRLCCRGSCSPCSAAPPRAAGRLERRTGCWALKKPSAAPASAAPW